MSKKTDKEKLLGAIIALPSTSKCRICKKEFEFTEFITIDMSNRDAYCIDCGMEKYRKD